MFGNLQKLHSMVNYTEEVLEARDTVIDAFVNIEGALNGTFRGTIRNTLSRHGVQDTTIKCVSGMLSDSEWNSMIVRCRFRE